MFLFFLTDTTEKVKNITRMELYTILKEFKGKKINEKFTLLEDRLANLTSCPTEERNVLSRSLRHFKTSFKQKWSEAHNTDERFIKNNEEWLETSLELPSWSSHKSGRPVKEFNELSERSKRRRTEELRAKVPVEELTFAACVSQGTSGNIHTSKMIKEITLTPTRAKNIRRTISSKKDQVQLKYTLPEALSLFVEGNFTRRQWNLLQGGRKTIYPCYSLLQKAKKSSYPDEDKITVTEISFNVELQALLDHTALRLIEYLKEVIDKLTDSEKLHLMLISKWGCDGSHQTPFKQKFENVSHDDSNIFVSSIVPVRLVVTFNGKTTKTIWQNPTPSSVRFCRPIRARFIQESKDVTKEEIEFIENQEKDLNMTIGESQTVKISHKLLLTMVDGKVCNAVTDTTSTMRCYICSQTSKDFNKLEKGVVNKEYLKFGLSVLHARIRFMELLLHLAYKEPIKKWQARTPEEKNITRERKEKIQKYFKVEMGLLVDVPKPGFGNSNDGNTSRRFFENAESSSRITGINIGLMNRFKVILEVISSGHEIDHQKFDEYAQDTGKLYVELYGWHPMSPTVHKILVHGAQVMEEAILPIGQMSEEAGEARNKHLRKYRVDFARKFSRTECNRDVLNRLLLTSDPLISCSRPKSRRKLVPFSDEAKAILIAAAPFNISDDITVHDDDDDDEEDSDIISLP